MNHKKIIVQWKEFLIPKTLQRNTKLNIDTDFIITVTGPRRAGKTYLCFQTINDLIKKGISKENILYINFEDEKLIGAQADDLSTLLEIYLELSEINKTQHIYLFFDEIQNVTNWDAWIRRTHDTEKTYKIIITGSSSKLLSKEISTKLRGRVLNTELFPLSFSEYLKWKNITYNLKNLSYSKNKIQVKKHFSHYLTQGGYPALFSNETSQEAILQSYYESMIFKDIVERYNIKDTKKLKILASLLFESTSKEISYNRLAHKLKSLGFSLSLNTIIEHISYFEEAYLFFQNLKYEYSIQKQLGSIKKIYCIDNGLLNSVSFKFSEDVGKLIENLVYIELKRRKKEIFYHKKKYECDFVIKEKDKIVQVIQVTHNLKDNYKREINGLQEAMDHFNIQSGTLITYDDAEETIGEEKSITSIPIWKWLLQDN